MQIIDFIVDKFKLFESVDRYYFSLFKHMIQVKIEVKLQFQTH